MDQGFKESQSRHVILSDNHRPHKSPVGAEGGAALVGMEKGWEAVGVDSWSIGQDRGRCVPSLAHVAAVCTRRSGLGFGKGRLGTDARDQTSCHTSCRHARWRRGLKADACRTWGTEDGTWDMGHWPFGRLEGKRRSFLAKAVL